MKTKFFNRLIVMGLAVMTVGNVWGATEETYVFSGKGIGTGSSTTYTITWDGGSSCTINQAKGSSSTSVSSSYIDNPRWYASHLVTFTPKSGVTITQIVITATGSGNNGQTMTFTTGTGTITNTSNTVTTVTGSWSSAMTLKMGSQCRVSSVKITYSAGDTWTLAGFDDWSNPISLSDGKFTKVLEAKTYTYNTSAGFKLIKNGSTYYGCNGTMTRATADGISWTFYSGDGNNNCGITADVAGTYTFALDASGANPKVTVTYPKVLSSISVKTAPTKTSYVEGQHFDPTGLVITKTYSDASTEDVSYASSASAFMFSPTTSTALTTSNDKVTITVGGKSVDQSITVKQYWTVSFVNNSQSIDGAKYADRKIEHNGEVGALPTLTSSDACDATSRVFMGWTTQKISSKTSDAPTFVTADTKVTQDMVLRAVWARQQ